MFPQQTSGGRHLLLKCDCILAVCGPR